MPLRCSRSEGPRHAARTWSLHMNTFANAPEPRNLRGCRLAKAGGQTARAPASPASPVANLLGPHPHTDFEGGLMVGGLLPSGDVLSLISSSSLSAGAMEDLRLRMAGSQECVAALPFVLWKDPRRSLIKGGESRVRRLSRESCSCI